MLSVPLRRISWLAALLALAASAGVAQAQQPLKEFTSTQGKFAILLPGTPKLIKQSVGGIDNFVYALESVGGLTYAVSYFDLPPKVVLSLDTSVQAYAKGRKGTVLSDKKIVLEDEYPGRDALVQLAGKSKASRIRIFIIGQRYYQLIVDGSQEAVTGKAVNEILDSFKRINP